MRIPPKEDIINYILETHCGLSDNLVTKLKHYIVNLY